MPVTAYGPTSAAVALALGGKLVVIDGRGVPWSFTPDEDNPGPTSVDTAFVLNEHLIAIEGGVAWRYKFGDYTWSKGVAVNAPIEGQPEGPWQCGANVEEKEPAPEEPEPAPTKRKAKEKEPA
jgi:hypothetical protein